MDGHHDMGDMGDMDMDGMSMSMTMYFYQSLKVKFLFDGYETESGASYFGVCVISLFFGFVTETLSIMQDKLDQ